MNILTLAITERMNNSDYQIIGLNMENQNIISLSGISKEDIISENDVKWDIGAITSVEKLIEIQGEQKYIVEGNVQLVKPFNREEFLHILKMKSYGRSNFFTNEKITYDIIRINKVLDIYQKNNKNYIKVSLYAKSNTPYNLTDDLGIYVADGTYMVVDFLVKDLRWINYWEWAVKTSNYETKRVIYRKQFNKVYHDKFAVVYRHTFQNYSKAYWVTGLHLL